MAALQLLEMEWLPQSVARGAHEAGIGQRRGCPTALMARAPASATGRIFLRKALLRRVWSHSASLRLALHLKKTHAPACPTARLGIISEMESFAKICDELN